METNKQQLYASGDSANLKLVIALNRSVNELNRQANAIFRKHGLTTMQFAVLEVLYHKGDLKIGQIIEKVLSTGGNMTVVITNLAKEGMVRKHTDASDSRASVISITDKGRQKMKDVFPEYLDNLRNNLMELNSEEKELLAVTLRKLSI